ncbi:hypothetical protein SUGI_0000990 [Cryptomeria japonica]|uniref:putative receptor protein kinase ZmPK1 n=1 Tax=Cryptomeria japonica TaxID=3369 RepID=UPI002408A479|nr:putative receptor protein kinase ZmPK1 [Cryptomeria japonica]GLJ04671.1 hypothetical protein SUGI_0000990 [Cryptomeria japonica]
MAFSHCVWLLRLFLTSALFHASFISSQRLGLGYSSPSPESNHTLLLSPDATFSAGFHRVGTNAYGFAVWYSNTPTLVWMANRDQPVNGKNSRLRLQKDGDLVLFNADGTVIWRTGTTGLSVKEAALLNTGNLLLRSSSSGKVVWQSFDSPTDTLLPGQRFSNNAQLISRMGNFTYKSGYYRFYFNDENYLVLLYKGSNLSSKYWPTPYLNAFDNGRTTYNISLLAVLDEFGGFSSSDQFSFNASDYGKGPKRRLVMDVDGNLRLYSLDEKRNSWIITWTAIANQCTVHGLCGRNGVCVYTPEPKCVCPPGYERSDSSDWFKGCRLITKFSCGPNSFKLIKLLYTDFYGFDRPHTDGVSFEKCRETCINECDCPGFAYSSTGAGQCYPKSLLINGHQSPGVTNHMYIKISVNDSSATNVSSLSTLLHSDTLQCSKLPIAPNPAVQSNISVPIAATKRTRNQTIILMASFVSAIGVIEIVCIALGWWFSFRNFNDAKLYSRQGYFAVPTGLKRFTFGQLREATSNFKDIVGKGGFGTVYKGCLLPENKVVAVKQLEGVSHGEDEFWAEVSMIGRVNHINLVRMFGFCAEGKHRLLVYEYVENGSLDKHIFTQNSSKVLDWKKRLQIAVGTAKGLAYLHEECLEWILHCDVKPQNILLDEQFQAKVSDFGLSKLVESGQDRDGALTFSTIRGTRGYLAPEWTMNLPITAKADVYSFGILLLELVSGREAAKFNMGGSGLNFVQWAFENVRAGKWIYNVVDAGAGELTCEEEFEVERVVKIALVCVEHERDYRPSMSEVVEMLTGAGSIPIRRRLDREDNDVER